MSLLHMPGAPPPGGKIIGEPEVTEGYFLVNIKCSCGTTNMLFGLPGLGRQCSNPECDWEFAITGVPAMSPAGLAWKIGWRRSPKEPPK
jgi:hypothetical protein